MTATTSPACHAAFELISRDTIDALGVTLCEYRHRNTGASHYHIEADNAENVFLVALRTLPNDSKGVAHILEHTALCGSEKYPVRDPFFMMIRRSLNSFMNAFTSSDWTAYPFASSNRKDFDNLLQVYLDAVFFSRLHPLDFAQEGHRLEFSERDNPSSPLQYKGVVFNEMKGAMSSIPSRLWHTLCKHLFPTVTYHHNSGGDPESIPDLSYEELKEFYSTHYHPSNAIFMTYGDIGAAEHQARFEELALNRFSALDKHIAVNDEKRYHAPMRVQESYPLPPDEDASGKTHIVLSWLLGKSTDLDSLLEAQLLAGILLDNSASPLLQALETSELGSSPSPMCGLEDSMREMVFACGLEGSEIEHRDAVEELVLGTLRRLIVEGVDPQQVESVLHQLELQQREISGDGYPYGLQLILNSLGAATHRGKPLEILDLDPALARLREKIADPHYIPSLLENLLDNPHRVTLVFSPDTQYQARAQQAEQDKLRAIQASLSETQQQAIIDQAQALAERQTEQEDESILPKVGLDDVALDIPELAYSDSSYGALPCCHYARGTNGLIYQQLLIELPALNDDEIGLLSLYTQTLTEIGLGQRSYLDVQAHQAAVCGGISAYTSIRGDINNPQQLKAYLVLSSKALNRNVQAQAQLMRDTLEAPRFDEYDRIHDMLLQMKARKESSITGNGHAYAMTAACAGMSPVAKIAQSMSGLDAVLQLRSLSEASSDAAGKQSLAQSLQALHSKVLAAKRQLLVIGEESNLASSQAELAAVWTDFQASGSTPLAVDHTGGAKREFWAANSQVNFCATAYPTVASGHPDAAPLSVLAVYLRNGILHRSIREQGGAYGGGASQDSNIAAFRFYSYRDPRLRETLADFDAAITWMLETPVNDDSLEQAILGVVGSIDKPGSPAGEAKQDFHSRVFGRSMADRRRFRSRVLAVTAEDLKRVTRDYLAGVQPSIAVVSNRGNADQLQEWLSTEGIELRQL